MHGNSGLSDVADKNAVLSANLRLFLERRKDAIVIDDDVKIEDFVREYMQSHPSNDVLCFYDCTAILNQYKTWFAVFGDVQPFYAMKCNPSEGMMDLMTSLPGMCVDCASVTEIKACLARGISPSSIIFANPVKSVEGISFMREKGVWCCTLDSVEEVTKMHSVLGDDAAKCRVVLRLYVDDHHSLIPLGSKFGCRLDEVDAILAELKKYNMPAVGVAFHVGSGNEDENAYDKAIANAKTVFDKAKQFGYSMNLLDMGGGWAGTLGGNAHRNEGLESEARIIRAALETKGMSAIPELKLIAEPGRYFNEQVITLGATITHVTERNGLVVYRVNEGVTGMFKDTVLADLKVLPVALEGAGKEFPSRIIGPGFTEKDVITKEKDVLLPRMKAGDNIMFRNMGAYTMSISSEGARASQKPVYFIRKSSLN